MNADPAIISVETSRGPTMASSEDYGKYFRALGSRSVRRVAADVQAAHDDHLPDAPEGIDALREIDLNEEENR